MKRIACFLIALSIMISIFAPLSFAEVHPKYYTVPVEYSDNIGHPESLDVMIQDDHVYVDAKMIADRLGYTFGENDERAVIFNKDTTNGLPVSITQFDYNSTRVSHMLFNKMLDTYEAPFMSIKNDEGSWIPLEYGLLLMNSGMVITNDTIRIDTPTKNIVDYFLDIAKNAEIYSFDWADDFGYTDTVTAIKGASSHIVNVFNGVLECDGPSWASLFQQFVGSSDSYDGKYGEDLALLLCTESENELQAASEKVELMCDLLDADGDLGGLLSFTSKMLDFNVGSLYKQCETVLDAVRDGNADAVRYSRSYQALEAALDKQTWFSHTGGNLLEVQKGVSNTVGDTFKVLNIAMKIAEIVGYVREFQNQDDFSLEALTHYLDTADKGLELPSQMKQSMINYSDALAGTVAGYTSKRFLDHADEWVTDAVKNKLPLHQVLGAQAAAALIAWNIVSKTVPLIANGLSSADNYELALYSQVFQGDTFLNYLEKRNAVFSDAENITAENLYEIAQYCFIYLKTCCVTREAALASLENYLSSTKEESQPLIDYQNSINEEIAGILVELKAANATNDNCAFGFLPSNNETYLNEYNDTNLIEWITLQGNDEDPFQTKLSELAGTYGLFAPVQTGEIVDFQGDWLNPIGIMGAQILDLDLDGSDEMLVCRAEACSEPDSLGPQMDASHILIQIYENQDGQAVLQDSQIMGAYNPSPYYETDRKEVLLRPSSISEYIISVHILWLEGQPYLFCEYQDGSTPIADGCDQAYWMLEYTDSALQDVCSYTQTSAGSSEFHLMGYQFQNGVPDDGVSYYSEYYEYPSLYPYFGQAMDVFFSQYGIKLQDWIKDKEIASVSIEDSRTVLSPNNQMKQLFLYSCTETSFYQDGDDWYSQVHGFTATLHQGNDLLEGISDIPAQDSLASSSISPDKDVSSQGPAYLNENIQFTASGTLVERPYEINSQNKGIAYILQLDAPFTARLYAELPEYTGEVEEINEIQIDFQDPANSQLYLGKHIIVTGTVMYGHTGHHLTTVLLMDATLNGLE